MEPRNARDETWPAHLFDETWCKLKRSLKKTKMASKRDFLNGEIQCYRSEKNTAKVPAALSQETHVEVRQAAASRSPPRC